MNDNYKVVYSSGPKFSGKPKEPPPPQDKLKQTEPVRLSFAKARKGKGLTIISRLQMHPQGKEDLLKSFKKRLGVGGTVKNGELEIQGNHLDFLETEMQKLGYKTKRI
jgi:predicted translation initiation factor SUI1